MEIEEIETLPVLVTGNEVALLQEKAQIDIQVSTAHAFPRNIKRATENAIAVATLDQETAETCNYALPRAGKAITGPSVNLAKIIIQVWGNMRTESKVISVDETSLTSQGIAWDLESNVAMKAEVKRSIMQNEYSNGKKTGKMIRMNDDMIIVTGRAANSIALREAIFCVVPRAVTVKVYKAALQMITGDISDATKLLKRRKQVFDGLKDTYGLKDDDILKAVGKAAVDHITGEDIVVLIGIGQAIKDGDTTVDQAFKGAKIGLKTDTAKKETEKLVDLINKAKSKKELTDLGTIPDDLLDLYNVKLEELK